MQCADPGRAGLRQRALDTVAHPVGEGADDFILHHEQITDFPIVEMGPEVVTGAGVDKLRVDLEPVADFLLAALQHIVHSEVSADLANIGGLAAVLEARIAGDYGIGPAAGEFGNQTFGDGIAQIALICPHAVILERQHGNDGPVVAVGADFLERPGVGPDQNQKHHQPGRNEHAEPTDRTGHGPRDLRCRYQTIALSRMGQDCLVSVVAEGAPDVGNALDQAVVGHKGVRPHRRDQISLRHDPSGMPCQMGQHLGALAAKARRPALLISEFPGSEVELHRSETHDFGVVRANFVLVSGHLVPPSGLLSYR
jgi:hypothetical protein